MDTAVSGFWFFSQHTISASMTLHKHGGTSPHDSKPRVSSPHKPVTGHGVAPTLVIPWCSGWTPSPEARDHGWGAGGS